MITPLLTKQCSAKGVNSFHLGPILISDYCHVVYFIIDNCTWYVMNGKQWFYENACAHSLPSLKSCQVYFFVAPKVFRGRYLLEFGRLQTPGRRILMNQKKHNISKKMWFHAALFLLFCDGARDHLLAFPLTQIFISLTPIPPSSSLAVTGWRIRKLTASSISLLPQSILCDVLMCSGMWSENCWLIFFPRICLTPSPEIGVGPHKFSCPTHAMIVPSKLKFR